MWPNPQETADFVAFTEKILLGSFIFCAVNALLNQFHQIAESNQFDNAYSNILRIISSPFLSN